MRGYPRWRMHWDAFLCALFGHHHGEASDVGLVSGVVCYRCGTRMHRCKRDRRAERTV